MRTQEKLEVLKHIKLGTNEVLYYPYNDGQDPLPLRPISSWELDECLFKAIENAPEKIAELVIKFKLEMIKPEQNINVSDEGYAQLIKFYNSIDYWIVYYAMKDFQDEIFSMPDYNSDGQHPKGFYIVLKMDDVHEIAGFVLGASTRSEEIIKEIFTDDMGREIAYYNLYLKIPLSNIGDITKLQRDYIIYSKHNFGKIIEGKKKESKYIISGETMTVEELLKRFK